MITIKIGTAERRDGDIDLNLPEQSNSFNNSGTK